MQDDNPSRTPDAVQDAMRHSLLTEAWLRSEPDFLPGEERAVRALFAWCCVRNNVPPVMAKRISVRWSNRMTRAAGKASSQGELILSAPLAWAMSYVERRNTVIHESCHIIVGVQHGHGHLWRAAMVRCGEQPDRGFARNKVDWAKVPQRRRPPRYAYGCGCRTWDLSAVRHRRIQRGAIYCCPTCASPLEQGALL